MIITNKEYAALAIQANEEGKVIFKKDDGSYALIDQEIFNTCNYVNNEWILDENKKSKLDNLQNMLT